MFWGLIRKVKMHHNFHTLKLQIKQLTFFKLCLKKFENKVLALAKKDYIRHICINAIYG